MPLFFCQIDKDRFTTISGHFFANYLNIFHKIKVQTVIRCLLGLNLNWFNPSKVMTQKVAIHKWAFFTKLQMTGNGKNCAFCHIFLDLKLETELTREIPIGIWTMELQ